MPGPQNVKKSVFRAATAGTVLGLYLLFVACGSPRPAASDGNMTNNGVVMSGPCTSEGATADCHVETGRVGTIVNCFSGTQTCTGGLWGPCGGGSGTLSTFDLSLAGQSARGGSLVPLAVTASAPSADAGACASNPCNPYCLGIDVDAGALTTGSFTSTSIVGTVKNVSDFPAGAGGPKNAMGSVKYVGSPDRIDCSLQPPYPPADNTHCSSDFCCASYTVGTSTSTCQPWVVTSGDNPIALSNCAKAPGVDFQVGLACQDATTGDVHVPACNRGTGNATTGTVMVAEYSGNPKYSGNADACQNPGSPSASCRINLATKPIAAGKCIDLNVNAGFAGTVPGVTCTSLFSGGNRTMMVNPPATTGYTTLAEGDPCNNYGFHPTSSQGGVCAAYGTQPPPPSSQSFTYNAICPTGSGVRWNQFAYSTTVPNASDVLFAVSTAPRLPDGGAGTFTAPVTAAHPATPLIADPAVCPMSGPAPCPKNLNTLLGAGATNEVLKLDVTLTATSAMPTVTFWQVTFSCIPNE